MKKRKLTKKLALRLLSKLILVIFIILILLMIWQTKSRFAFLGIGFWFLFIISNWFWWYFWNFFLKFSHQKNDGQSSISNLELKLKLSNLTKFQSQNPNKIENKIEIKNAVRKEIQMENTTKSSKIYSLKPILKSLQFVNFIQILQRFWFGFVIFLPIFVGIVAINLQSEILNKLPVEIAKPSSTFWHEMRTKATLELIDKNPEKWFLGFGLGASGPAAKMEYYNIKEAEIFRKNERIAYDYRLVGDDLTIPENWFLQVFLNGGIFYFLLYLSILLIPVSPLFGSNSNFFGKIFDSKLPESDKIKKNLNIDKIQNLEIKAEKINAKNTDNPANLAQNIDNNLQIWQKKPQNSKFLLTQNNLESQQNTDKDNFNFQNNSSEKTCKKFEANKTENAINLNLINLIIKKNLKKLQLNSPILASLSFFGILVGNLFLHIFEAQVVVLYWSLLYLWANLD